MSTTTKRRCQSSSCPIRSAFCRRQCAVTDAETRGDERTPPRTPPFVRGARLRQSARPPRGHDLRSHLSRRERPRRPGDAQRDRRLLHRSSRRRHSMDILIYQPNDQPKPVPSFLVPNFQGNHSIHSDPGITLSQRWMRNRIDRGIRNHRATVGQPRHRPLPLARRTYPRTRLRHHNNLLWRSGS